VTAIAGVVLGIISIVQVPLTILVLVGVNDAEVPIHHELKQLFTNPVLVSLFAGLAVGSAGLDVPAAAASGLDVVGGASRSRWRCSASGRLSTSTCRPSTTRRRAPSSR